MCGLRTRPRTDVDPPRVELPSAGDISSRCPRGDVSFDLSCSLCCRFTHCTVEGLSPSHDYQFRVIAENFYGRSDPCEPTSLVQTVTEQEGRRKKGLGDTDGQYRTVGSLKR